MSLIHKALKKAEQGSNENQQDFSQMTTPEEGLIDNKTSSSSSLPPRTIVLIVLTVLALAFAIYNNFIKPKKGSVPKPTDIASAQAPVVPVVPQQPVLPQQDLSGVSRPAEVTEKASLPPQVEALKKEGEDMFFAGQLDAALAKFDEAKVMAPTSAEILNSMGLVYKKKGDLDKAQSLYLEALRMDPNCSECLNNLGVVEVDKGDYLSAVLHLKKAVTIDREYSDPYFNLAIVMEKEGNIRSAIDNYKEFLKYTKTNDQGIRDDVRARVENLASGLEE